MLQTKLQACVAAADLGVFRHSGHAIFPACDDQQLFGTGDSGQALLIASGIALQNIPEGMVIIAPMLAAGISPRKTMVCAIATGVVEVIGTLIGYWAVNIATVILPIALSFAGGTMLYVVSDEMLNETHAHGHERAATYSMIVGFCVMLVLDVLLG